MLMNKREYYLLMNPASGISGDMFCSAMASLIIRHETHAGMLHEWEEFLNLFGNSLPDPLDEIRINLKSVSKKGMQGENLSFVFKHNRKSFSFQGKSHGLLQRAMHMHRPYHKIRETFHLVSRENPEYENILSTAEKIYHRLAAVEARLHGQSIDNVELHEAGSEDSILDVLSAAWLFFRCGQPYVYSSEVNLAGSGTINFSHGEVALPVPAVTELLHGFPVHFTKLKQELTTPTGAAILRSLEAKPIAELNFPVITLTTGYGAGSRILEDRPNILRISLAEKYEKTE